MFILYIVSIFEPIYISMQHWLMIILKQVILGKQHWLMIILKQVILGKKIEKSGGLKRPSELEEVKCLKMLEFKCNVPFRVRTPKGRA
jgi:hypothetical protein